jgi:hypothetical protein
MTNAHNTPGFWTDIRDRFKARAEVISGFEPSEYRATLKLKYASDTLACAVDDFDPLSYDALVDFVMAYRTLRDAFNWDRSDVEELRGVIEAGAELFDELEDRDTMLTMDIIHGFQAVRYRLGLAMDVAPNEYQLSKFAEHGIEWTGKVHGG